MSVALALRPDVVAAPLREINDLEHFIVTARADIEAALREQARLVVELLRGGMSQRAVARGWVNIKTGEPYSQMHVSFVARAFEKCTFQPGLKFREAYNQVANAAKREADTQKQLSLAGADPDAADLRNCSCSELFASDIRPAAVITEPPRGFEHFLELARACADVPHVAVRMDPNCLLMPAALSGMSEHLTYRGSVIRDNRLTLMFCQDDEAFARATTRARAIPGATSLRPYLNWDEFLIQQLTDPGELVCDPFLQPATAVAALEFGRRFVGCHTDPGVVADARRQIGAAR